MDRFHTIYSIGREKFPTDICGPGERLTRKQFTSRYRSSMARAMEVNGKARQAEGEGKVVS